MSDAAEQSIGMADVAAALDDVINAKADMPGESEVKSALENPVSDKDYVDNPKENEPEEKGISKPTPSDAENAENVVALVSPANGEDEGVLPHVSDLPIEVQKRIRALRKNQVSILNTECDFYKAMLELELRYQRNFEQYFQQRKAIISGEHEPTDEECNFSIANDPMASNNNTDTTVATTEGSADNDPISGIPCFWLTIFQSVGALTQVLEECDIPILLHLMDIRVVSTTEPVGFKLEFQFSPNEFFTNAVLEKSYTMKYELDSVNPLTFEGPEIVSCKGCEINWKPDKDVTKTVTDKRQKHKRTGNIRVIQKVEKVPSFFNFFSPPENKDDLDVDILNSDFELGQFFRERIIPRAVLYFTGEATDYDDFSMSSSGTEMETEDDGASDEDGIDEFGDNV